MKSIWTIEREREWARQQEFCKSFSRHNIFHKTHKPETNDKICHQIHFYHLILWFLSPLRCRFSSINIMSHLFWCLFINDLISGIAISVVEHHVRWKCKASDADKLIGIVIGTQNQIHWRERDETDSSIPYSCCEMISHRQCHFNLLNIANKL